jgi:hypothetical protein
MSLFAHKRHPQEEKQGPYQIFSWLPLRLSRILKMEDETNT